MSSVRGRLSLSFEFEHSLEPCASLGHLVQSTTRRNNGCTKLLSPRKRLRSHVFRRAVKCIVKYPLQSFIQFYKSTKDKVFTLSSKPAGIFDHLKQFIFLVLCRREDDELAVAR